MARPTKGQTTAITTSLRIEAADLDLLRAHYGGLREACEHLASELRNSQKLPIAPRLDNHVLAGVK